MTSKTLAQLMEEWSKDAYAFVRDAIGVVPDVKNNRPGITKQQKDALKKISLLLRTKEKVHFQKGKCTVDEIELAKKMGISIMSGKGTGKDTFASWVIIWLLCCVSNVKIPCTAPSGHQLKDVLWAEINKWIDYGDKQNDGLISEMIEWHTTQVKAKHSLGFASARTIKTNGSAEEQGEVLAGRHEDYMVIVADEASAIPDAVFRPLETTLTGFCNFVICIFNPTRSTGFAIDSQTKNRKEWICLHWSAEDSENVSSSQIERMAEKYGKNSNMYRINVLGLPPKAESDVIIPLDWVMAAVNREDVLVPEKAPLKAAMDIGGGSDKNVFLTRKGKKVELIEQNDDPNTMHTAQWGLGMLADTRSDVFFQDIIGIGQGVWDRMKEIGIPCSAHGIKGSNASSNADKYHYLIDELWWNMRKDFEDGVISIPDDDELITELSSRKFKKDERGRLKIETKYDMKKRGIRSPNKADALALTYYIKDTIYDKELQDDYDAYSRSQKKSLVDKARSWLAA